MHEEQLGAQKEFDELKAGYIALNEELGEKEQELAELRELQTQQMNFNREK